MRDKYLTEVVGGHVHTYDASPPIYHYSECVECGWIFDGYYKDIFDFSTWPGFGKLWEWAQEQEWFEEFLNIMDAGEYINTPDGWTCDIQKEFISPDVFATTVYKFLKGREV